MASTRVTRRLQAPRPAVYAALIDPGAIARWKFPAEMTCEIQEYDGSEGGEFRISLTYLDPLRTGKSGGRTDTYRGRFVTLVPDELVIEKDEFESADPALQGEMTISISLADAVGGTDLVAVHDGLPAGLSLSDNETGWREALERLAELVETS